MSTPQESDPAAELFVEKLGKALHAYGTPSHRLEEALSKIAQKLGLAGQFFSTPTGIFASYGEPQRTRLMRVDPGEVHLEKLSRLDGVLARVVTEGLGPHEASILVDEIVDAPPRWGTLVSTLSFALVSGSAARFLGGGWREIVVATLGGLLIGLWALVAGRFANAGRLFEPVGAILVALVAILATAVTSPLSSYIVMVAGLIVLIPGLTVTLAMNELAERNLVSGSARLAGAVLVFLTIGFGVALGTRLGTWLVGARQRLEPAPLPAWTEILALLVVAMAFTVLFKAYPRDVGWILGAGAVALGGARLGAQLLGPQLGALLAAFLVGIGSNLVARLADRPVAITQLPGLMLLVPGSIGFRGLSALLEEDILAGVQAGFTMGFVAIALVTGLLMANVVVPPRRAL
jgi:uncharacterized membrane protein YjjP (DUF1212 family)